MEFYDIAMHVPAAVNPWKSRLTLNFKGVTYSTKWVKIPDIPQVRQGLDVPACRKRADGEDYYTLPILVDPKTGSKIGDSFDIAIYLQETYPSSGAGDLFPAQVLDFTYDRELPPWAPPLSVRNDEAQYAEYSKFNSHVDAAFSIHAGLMGSGMTLDSEESKSAFLGKIGLKSWDELEIKGEAREQMMESLREVMGDIAKLYSKDTSGPFILGQKATYADLIVGGWLHMMHATLPDSEWQAAKGWHNGVFGELFDSLEKYAEIK